MCGGWSQGRGRPLPETFPMAQCLRPDPVLGTALPGHILTFLQGPLARSVLGGGCGWVPRAGTSWPTNALDVFWCTGLGVSRRGVISNQDHLSRVNCLHHGLVARQGMVPLGPPKPEAPKNRGQRPLYEKGLSVPDGQGWAAVGVVSSWLCR